jgi:hypothetical protein
MKEKNKKREENFTTNQHEPHEKGNRGIEPECSCKNPNATALHEQSRRMDTPGKRRRPVGSRQDVCDRKAIPLGDVVKGGIAIFSPFN